MEEGEIIPQEISKSPEFENPASQPVSKRPENPAIFANIKHQEPGAHLTNGEKPEGYVPMDELNKDLREIVQKIHPTTYIEEGRKLEVPTKTLEEAFKGKHQVGWRAGEMTTESASDSQNPYRIVEKSIERVSSKSWKIKTGGVAVEITNDELKRLLDGEPLSKEAMDQKMQAMANKLKKKTKHE